MHSAYRMHLKHKRGGGQTSEGIRYRHAPADEQPLTWSSPQGRVVISNHRFAHILAINAADDDDDDPLLT